MNKQSSAAIDLGIMIK